jgi:hypothetical protein
MQEVDNLNKNKRSQLFKEAAFVTKKNLTWKQSTKSSKKVEKQVLSVRYALTSVEITFMQCLTLKTGWGWSKIKLKPHKGPHCK